MGCLWFQDAAIWGGNCANQTNLLILNGSGTTEHWRPEFSCKLTSNHSWINQVPECLGSVKRGMSFRQIACEYRRGLPFRAGLGLGRGGYRSNRGDTAAALRPHRRGRGGQSAAPGNDRVARRHDRHPQPRAARHAVRSALESLLDPHRLPAAYVTSNPAVACDC